MSKLKIINKAAEPISLRSAFSGSFGGRSLTYQKHYGGPSGFRLRRIPPQAVAHQRSVSASMVQTARRKAAGTVFLCSSLSFACLWCAGVVSHHVWIVAHRGHHERGE